jgi:hypothetical protein
MSKYHSFNKARRRNFANPTFSPTPTYAGDLVLPFLTPAVKSGDTLANNYVRTIDGITNKAVIQTTELTDPLQAGGSSYCGFDTGDNISIGETVLELSDIKVNEEMCRALYLPSWVSQRGSRLRSDAGSNEFRNFLLATVASKVAEGVENAIWKGNTTTTTVGLLGNDGGTLDAAAYSASRLGLGGAVESTIDASMTAANVIASIGGVYADAVDNVPGLVTKPDTKIFVSNKTAALYRQALATSGAFDSSNNLGGQGYNNQVTNQAFATLNFLGIEIAECSGMQDDCIVIAQSENLIVGSNLMTDLTDVNYIPVYQFDGSDNVRITMQFGLGTQVGIGSDAVVGALAAVFA